jgi:hypothetical protein
MFVFALFDNNVDRNANLTIADKLGHKADYEAALAFFNEKNLRRNLYVIIRKDSPTDNTPQCYTNMFEEFAHKIGKNPVLFAPKL